MALTGLLALAPEARAIVVEKAPPFGAPGDDDNSDSLQPQSSENCDASNRFLANRFTAPATGGKVVILGTWSFRGWHASPSGAYQETEAMPYRLEVWGETAAPIGNCSFTGPVPAPDCGQVFARTAPWVESSTAPVLRTLPVVETRALTPGATYFVVAVAEPSREGMRCLAWPNPPPHHVTTFLLAEDEAYCMHSQELEWQACMGPPACCAAIAVPPEPAPCACRGLGFRAVIFPTSPRPEPVRDSCTDPEPCQQVQVGIDVDGGPPWNGHLGDYLPRGCDPGTGACPVIHATAWLPPGAATGQTATFTVSSSAYPGIAMNAAMPTEEEDFVLLDAGPRPFDGAGFATAAIRVTDWGGAMTLSVAASNGCSASTGVPLDANENLIGDVAWEAIDDYEGSMKISDAAEPLDACADDEFEPPSPGLAGDGLTAWEEYRGFFMRGTHARTNPRRRDYFVAPENFEAAVGFGDIAKLPTWDHWLRSGDLQLTPILIDGQLYVRPVLNWARPATCPVNDEVGLREQRGVRCKREEANPAGTDWGVSSFEPGCWPFATECFLSCSVYSGEIRVSTPPSFLASVIDDIDTDAHRWILSHEAGHGAGLLADTPAVPGVTDTYAYDDPTGVSGSLVQRPTDCRPPSGGPPACGPASSMVIVACYHGDCPWWASPTCGPSPPGACGTAPYWRNLPAGYDGWDGAQLRLRRFP